MAEPSIPRRVPKADHLRICLEEDVAARGVTSGFERYRFVHRALPEIDLHEVDLSATFLGHALKAPLLVSPMTGGTPDAAVVNRRLAQAAQLAGSAMAVGSQRAAIEAPELAATYRVRDVAPDVLLFANLGAVQLNKGYGIEECARAVEMIEADSLILHLNPLQEALQPGGDVQFRGLLDRIREVILEAPFPVVVKEVGWGLSAEVAGLLAEAGVAAIDVAGAGGTSWSEVEARRAGCVRADRAAEAFADWGIPTAECLRQARSVLPEHPLIASGGVRSGVDAAKALALGADLAGIATPLLRAAAESQERTEEALRGLIEELRIAMFCCGVRTLVELRGTRELVEVGGHGAGVAECP